MSVFMYILESSHINNQFEFCFISHAMHGEFHKPFSGYRRNSDNDST